MNQRYRRNNLLFHDFSPRVWDLAGIELATPGSAVGLATDCATRPGPGATCRKFLMQVYFCP